MRRKRVSVPSSESRDLVGRFGVVSLERFDVSRKKIKEKKKKVNKISD